MGPWIGSCIGVLLGVMFFWPSFNGFSDSTSGIKLLLTRYSGTVESVDESKKTIRLSVKSSYPLITSEIPVLISYDDKTQWGYVEFDYQGDTVMYQKSGLFNGPQQLPPGTLLTLLARDQPGRLSADLIQTLRRNAP